MSTRPKRFDGRRRGFCPDQRARGSYSGPDVPFGEACGGIGLGVAGSLRPILWPWPIIFSLLLWSCRRPCSLSPNAHHLMRAQRLRLTSGKAEFEKQALMVVSQGFIPEALAVRGPFRGELE